MSKPAKAMPDMGQAEQQRDRDPRPSTGARRDGHATCCADGDCHCRETELLEQAEQYRSIFEATSDALIISDLDGFAVEVNPAACAMYGYSRDEFIGLPRTAFVHPSSHHLIDTSIQAARDGDTLRFQAVDVRNDGTPFHVEGRGTRFMFRGGLHLLAVVRDISEQVETENRLREKEEQYRSIFESSLDAILIADQSGVMVEANPAACRLYGYNRDELIGLHGTQLLHPDSQHLVGRALETTRSGEPVWAQAVAVRKNGSTFHIEGRAIAFAYRGKPHILSLGADITERVRSQQAVQEERQRLSRELHDSVSQALHGIGVGADTTQILIDRDPARARASNDYVRSLARTGLAEMRALIFDLRPEVLEQEGLAAALERQVGSLQARHQISVEMTPWEDPDVPFPVTEVLYRIAQEALHNSVKHAQATRVQLSLCRRDGQIILEIRDNGAGFDTGATFPGHLGLQSMRERVTHVGGSLELESAAGEGTVIRARVPQTDTRA